MTKLKNIFNEKGSAAEALVADLCSEAFFQDFCFQNPYVGTGKDRKELCDVLVVLGDTAIIWQIKNIKLGENGHFKQSDITKAVNQCRGAKRKLGSLGKIQLVNVAGEEKTIDTANIKTVHLVAAIEGGLEEFGSFFDESDKGNVHIFFENFTRFATKHLNTVSDFVRYLSNKERFMAGKSVIIGGGEEELLAVYLNNNRTFGNAEEGNANVVYFDIEGTADDLEKDKGYQAKQGIDDHWSKAWDMLIEKKREGLIRPGDEDDPEARDKFLAKMMSHDRFERRILGKTYIDAAVEATKGSQSKDFVYRRYYKADGVTYVFAFMGDLATKNESRQTMLHVAALAARKKFPENSMVIAVVSERNMIKEPNGCSFDWVMFDLNNAELQANLTPQIEEFMEKYNFLQNPKVQAFTAYEYPEDIPKG